MRTLLILLALSTYSCKETYLVGQIVTPQGEMLFWLYEETLIHKQSFIQLASSGYWDSLTFNRVVQGFVVQGGCPDTPEGFADSPYLLQPEFRDTISHTYGALGAGRDMNPDKLSAGCQLYIVQNTEGITRLDGDYTIFGQLFKGFDVLEAIASVKVDSLDQPLNDIPMEVNVLSMTSTQLKDLGYLFEEE